jgi:hypothetical protein
MFSILLLIPYSRAVHAARHNMRERIRAAAMLVDAGIL